MDLQAGIIEFLIAQSVIIVGAVLISYISLRVAIAKLQVEMKHSLYSIADLHEDHKALVKKVEGISRHVIATEMLHLQCPYVNGAKKATPHDS